MEAPHYGGVFVYMKKILTNKTVSVSPIPSIKNLCFILNETESSLKNLVKNVPHSYREIYIVKPDGTKRRLDSPNLDLKTLQRKILDYYLNKIPLPKYVYGIGKKKTIIENAGMHLRSNELISIDIKNFFPSVHYTRVNGLFVDMGCEDGVSKTLTKLVTLNYCLPQGAPTSPYIASLVLFNLDLRIFNLCRAMRLTYTRYFDDIFISGHLLPERLKSDLIKIIEEEGYICKAEKIHHYKRGTKKLITGLTIQDKKLSVDNKEELLAYLKKIKRDGVTTLKTDNPEKERLILQGKVNFISSVSPAYGKILKRVFESIDF